MPFTVSLVSDEKELTEIYRLRYKVYCEEWGFEKPKDYPAGIETDDFDKSSLHFAAENGMGSLVGTIRLILNSPLGFPLEKYCQINIDKNKFPRENLAEISRLAISKKYRRRAEDKYIYGPDEERRGIDSFNSTGKIYRRRAEDRHRNGFSQAGKVSNERRKRHEVVVSLYKAIYQESKRRQITHWYAVMTKGLYILLKKFGFNFQAIGESVDYHGIRTPYLGEIKKIEQEVLSKSPELYKEFTKGLQTV